MCVQVSTKFQVSSIILTSFKREVILPNPAPAKRTPKNSTQTKVNLKTIPNRYNPCFKHNYLCISPSVDGQLVVLLQIGVRFYYKQGSFVLLQVGASVITNWGSLVTTKWDRRYYKLGQTLLQIRVAITNWGNYYKLGHNMQSVHSTRFFYKQHLCKKRQA